MARLSFWMRHTKWKTLTASAPRRGTKTIRSRCPLKLVFRSFWGTAASLPGSKSSLDIKREENLRRTGKIKGFVSFRVGSREPEYSLTYAICFGSEIEAAYFSLARLCAQLRRQRFNMVSHLLVACVIQGLIPLDFNLPQLVICNAALNRMGCGSW